MSINWGIIFIILATSFIWYGIFKIGFWHTILWIILGAILGGIILKIKEKKDDYTRYLG